MPQSHLTSNLLTCHGNCGRLANSLHPVIIPGRAEAAVAVMTEVLLHLPSGNGNGRLHPLLSGVRVFIYLLFGGGGLTPITLESYCWLRDSRNFNKFKNEVKLSGVNLNIGWIV